MPKCLVTFTLGGAPQVMEPQSGIAVVYNYYNESMHRCVGEVTEMSGPFPNLEVGDIIFCPPRAVSKKRVDGNILGMIEANHVVGKLEPVIA